MFGQMSETFSIAESSTRIEADFFSVAITIPFVAGGTDESGERSRGKRRGEEESRAGEAGRGGRVSFHLDDAHVELELDSWPEAGFARELVRTLDSERGSSRVDDCERVLDLDELEQDEEGR